MSLADTSKVSVWPGTVAAKGPFQLPRLAMSPDGRRLAVAALQGTVGIWATDSEAVVDNIEEKRWRFDGSIPPDSQLRWEALGRSVTVGRLWRDTVRKEAIGLRDVHLGADGSQLGVSISDGRVFLWSSRLTGTTATEQPKAN